MKAWERKIKALAETLPDLYAPREVRMYKSGKEIIDTFDRKALKEFQEGLIESAKDKAAKTGKPVPSDAGVVQYDIKYTYFATVNQKINHAKRMRATYRRFGMQGVHEYAKAVIDKKAELDAEKLFKKRNRFYLKWYRSIKEQLARASRAFGLGAKKPA